MTPEQHIQELHKALDDLLVLWLADGRHDDYNATDNALRALQHSQATYGLTTTMSISQRIERLERTQPATS